MYHSANGFYNAGHEAQGIVQCWLWYQARVFNKPAEPPIFELSTITMEPECRPHGFQNLQKQ